MAKKKTEEEIDHENGQLDNLFLTLRESIVEEIDEKHLTDKKKEVKKEVKQEVKQEVTEDTKKKTHAKKKKHHHHKKAPEAKSLL